MKLRLLVFLGIILSLSVSSALYISAFIGRGVVLSQGDFWVIFGALGSVFPLFIVSDFLRRQKQWRVPYVMGSILLGSYSIAVGVITCGYVVLFLGGPVWITVAGCGVVTGLLVVLALVTHGRGPTVVPIDLSSYPPFSDRDERLVVVHLSDIHLTHHTRLDWVRSLVEKTNALSPDFIVFTGDLIDVDPSVIPEHIRVLSTLHARYGKFAVSGNHDFMTGIETFYACCQSLGFVCLDDAEASVAGITFVGMPDELSHRKTLPKIVVSGEPVIFLKHRPTRFKEAVRAGVNLQLSGHSHQGQLPPWGVLVKLRYQKYAYGLHRYKTGFIFTTRGSGVWGPPMRLFGRSEIVKFIL